MLKPWEKSHDGCEETDEVESGVWELAFHHPVGIGGTVADDAGGIVNEGYHKIHQEAAYENKPVDNGLWKERKSKHCWNYSLDRGQWNHGTNFVLNFFWGGMQHTHKKFKKTHAV